MGIRWDEIVAMPRPWRVQYPGAIYHLMSRGDHREPTFRDDIDRRRFLEVPRSFQWNRCEAEKSDWDILEGCQKVAGGRAERCPPVQAW